MSRCSSPAAPGWSLSGLSRFRAAPARFPRRRRAGVRIRAIKVDVSPIRASMGDPTAAWLEAGASRRARPVARALYGARRPQRGDAGGADRLSSIWGQAAAAPASLWTNAGHHHRRAPAERPARGRCRERAGCGRSAPISRWRSIRRWSSGPCRAASSPLRRCLRDGRRGSWGSRRFVCLEVIARHPPPRPEEPRAERGVSKDTSGSADKGANWTVLRDASPSAPLLEA